MKLKFILFASVIAALMVIYLLKGNSLDVQNLQSKETNEQTLPKNPLAGRIVFEQKGCINCHAINGYGGKTATDFGGQIFFGSDYDLIAEMWNHSPNMFKEMELKNVDKQNFSAVDFRNLRQFLNFLRYLGNNGNVNQGKELFAIMECSECHSIGEKNSRKIKLDKIGVYASPLYLAQVMWNHAAKMQKMQKLSSKAVPMFKGNEFADLSVYISAVNTYGKREKIYMSPGNPLKGKNLFVSKKCYYCHEQNHIGPDLTNYNFNKSVTEIAGMMWNHASNMNEAMERNKISYPAFKNDEMTNLISYLYFKNQANVKGSVDEGRKIIVRKGCVDCHSAGNSYGAPIMSAVGPFINADNFFGELWNHLPLMEKKSYTKGKSLPKLLPTDIKSLYLYFNRKER